MTYLGTRYEGKMSVVPPYLRYTKVSTLSRCLSELRHEYALCTLCSSVRGSYLKPCKGSRTGGGIGAGVELDGEISVALWANE